MSNRMHPNRRLVSPIAMVLVAAAGLAGCAGDTSKPKSVLHAMGAVWIDQTVPPGGPYQAAAVVALDGIPVTDATVTVNGAPLIYHSDPAQPERDGYCGIVSLIEGEPVTLSVSCSHGQKSAQATTPGLIEILSPPAGASFDDSEDIPVTWTPPEHASVSIVAYSDVTTRNAETLLMQKDPDSYALPASNTTPPATRIRVIAANGEGEMPMPDRREWIGQDGFWVRSEDWVDVQIRP